MGINGIGPTNSGKNGDDPVLRAEEVTTASPEPAVTGNSSIAGEREAASKAEGLRHNAARFSETAPVAVTAQALPSNRLAELTANSRQLVGDITSRMGEWKGLYGIEAVELAEDDIEFINKRLELLKADIGTASVSGETAYARDVRDALSILWNRTIRTERLLFDFVSDEKTFNVRFYDREPKGEASKERPPKSPGEIVQRIIRGVASVVGNIIDALVSRPRAGLVTPLRENQWEMVKGIQPDWGMHERRLKLNQKERWHEGVVVAPTGSGKTHVMAAAVELGIKEGWLDFTRDGRVVILTHLKQIGSQNLRRMRELLTPVFQKYYGRDVKVTGIGEGVWNAGGDVVIASVPTVGSERNIQRFRASVGGHILGIQDEYHHGMQAPSWKRAVSALKEASGDRGGYLLGFTATLPLHGRAGVNIVAEQFPTQLMKSGAIPAFEIVQVKTGVSLETIPTHYGNFKVGELSNTVRNRERYFHMMRALETDGVRDEGGGLAPTLIFGVDLAHIHEMARFYQLYFAERLKVAVIDDTMSMAEIDRVISAFRTKEPTHFTRYEYGAQEVTVDPELAKKLGLGRPELTSAGEFVETRVDGIVAVITGDTPSEVRKKILDASRRGTVEAVINAKVFGEGFDGWWVQNLVGARPSLSLVQRAQEVGRLLRYGPDEVDKTGDLLKQRKRIAFDLIDDRSGLVSYVEAIGLGDLPLHNKLGVRINAATGDVVGEAYGGMKDIFARDGERWKKLEVPLPDPKTFIKIKGEREHFLLPEEFVGEYARPLRAILKKEYRGNLAEMAFDLALPEEILVGYLNGGLPAEDWVAKRMGVLLYQGRGALLEAYSASRYDWKPLADIPEDRRELVGLVREKVLKVFGKGRLPADGFTTIDGWQSKQLMSSPINRFIQNGTMDPFLSRSYTPARFWRDLRDLVLNVERDEDGRFVHVNTSAEVETLMLKLVEKKENWIPLGKIPEEVRTVVELARLQVVRLFGGVIPQTHIETTDGWRSKSLARVSLRAFLQNGKTEFSWPRSPAKFVGDLIDILLSLERIEGGKDNGKLRRVALRPETEEMIFKMVEHKHKRVPLKEIPEPFRDLARVARKRAAILLGGALPQNDLKTVDGWKTGFLGNSPINLFLIKGVIDVKSLTVFWHNMFDYLLGIERIVDGSNHGRFRHVQIEEEGFNAVAKAVASLEGWDDIKSIPESTKELVEFARKKAILLFGGRRPYSGFETVDGWKSGIVKNRAREQFLKEWEVEFNNSLTPSFFWRYLIDQILGVERIIGGRRHGKFRHVKLDTKVQRLIHDVVAEQMKWLPLNEISSEVRPVLEAARMKAAILFGGKLPPTGFETEDGWKSGQITKDHPIREFLMAGKYIYSNFYPLSKFWRELRNFLLDLERSPGGAYRHVDTAKGFVEMAHKVIEKLENWVPLSDVKPERRPVLRLVRSKAIELFGGRLPFYGFKATDGYESGQLYNRPIAVLLVKGEYSFAKRTPHEFWQWVRKVFFSYRATRDGDYEPVAIDPAVEQIINALEAAETKEWEAKKKRGGRDPSGSPAGGDGGPAPAPSSSEKPEHVNQWLKERAPQGPLASLDGGRPVEVRDLLSAARMDGRNPGDMSAEAVRVRDAEKNAVEVLREVERAREMLKTAEKAAKKSEKR